MEGSYEVSDFGCKDSVVKPTNDVCETFTLRACLSIHDCRKGDKCSLCDVLCEMFGSTFLCLIACSVTYAIRLLECICHQNLAWAMSGAIVFLTCAFHFLSGAHFNPMTTIVQVLVGWFCGGQKGICLRNAFWYIIAQAVGYLLGALLVLAIVGSGTTLGTPIPNPSFSSFRIMFVEALGSFFITCGGLFIAKSTTRTFDTGCLPALGYGGVYLAVFISVGPITSPSMNIFRYIFPALISNTWYVPWAYILGPMLGSLIAGVFYCLCWNLSSPCRPKEC